MLPALLVLHLTLRACILCADLTILFLLHRQRLHQSLMSRPHRSTPRKISRYGSLFIIILKLGLDTTVLAIVVSVICTLDIKFEKASMTVAEKLSLAGASFDVAINICIRFSMTCATALEVSFQTQL